MRVVSCKMENGMLNLVIEKETPEEQKSRTIDIE
jgi:HSP20 family molecular chaperone IbpA